MHPHRPLIMCVCIMHGKQSHLCWHTQTVTHLLTLCSLLDTQPQPHQQHQHNTTPTPTPALGKPTSPTSATTLSMSCRLSCCPASPLASSFQFRSSTAYTSAPAFCWCLVCGVRCVCVCLWWWWWCEQRSKGVTRWGGECACAQSGQWCVKQRTSVQNVWMFFKSMWCGQAGHNFSTSSDTNTSNQPT